MLGVGVGGAVELGCRTRQGPVSARGASGCTRLLARTLHDARVIDEYRLLVFPVVLGAGKRLFAESCATSGFTISIVR